MRESFEEPTVLPTILVEFLDCNASTQRDIRYTTFRQQTPGFKISGLCSRLTWFLRSMAWLNIITLFLLFCEKSGCFRAGTKISEVPIALRT